MSLEGQPRSHTPAPPGAHLQEVLGDFDDVAVHLLAQRDQLDARAVLL